MSTVAVVVIVIVVIVVLGAAAYFARAQARRRGLQQRFGPEYDRAVKDHESTREAEQELLARQKRHDELEIRPLDPEVRERHLAEWRQVQERFVDAPETAVTEADRLVNQVMSERGYPAEEYEQQVADLSVEHATTIGRYRQAHDISARAEAEQASTEELRQAMVHYRALFTELLETGDDDGHIADRDADRTTDREAEAAPATTGTAESDAARTATPEATATGAKAEKRAEKRAGDETAAPAETGARATAGRRSTRRDSDDEGAQA